MMLTRMLMCCFVVFLVLGVFNVASGVQKVEPDWYEHIDIIVPGVIAALKTMGWIIGSLLSLLGLLFSILIKKYIADQAQRHKEHKENYMALDHKLDVIHDVMLSCDGCRDSAQKAAVKYGRRAEDVKVD